MKFFKLKYSSLQGCFVRFSHEQDPKHIREFLERIPHILVDKKF